MVLLNRGIVLNLIRDELATEFNVILTASIFSCSTLNYILFIRYYSIAQLEILPTVSTGN